MSEITRSVPKKDAMSLLLGKPVYTEDVLPPDALVVKLLRSPHAFAEIREIDTSRALEVPGIAGIYTYRDVPQERFTIAGQSVPQWSPYDRLLLDRIVRYAGDPVAIVAGETEEAVRTAMKRIRVEYDVKQPVFDPREAMDSDIILHPEENFRTVADFGADAKRNLCARDGETRGNAEEALKKCDYIVEECYHIRQVNQCMMETFRAFTQLDAEGRLVITSSTQIPFHVRRIVSDALGISESLVRVVKPRIGGGFGAKQTAVCEMYPALVTWKTGKPAVLIYSREETFRAGSPRHEMILHTRLGADREGHILAVEHRVLSNTGAYGEHGPTTIGLTGRQPISMYRYAKDVTFDGTVVYTNTVPAGAYRGFGVTQGAFAMESAVNELAHKMGADPLALRKKNAIQTGDPMRIYNGGEVTQSCGLRDCLETAGRLFRWEERSPARVMPDGKVRAGGMAMAMQGSGIAHVDTASAAIRLLEDGSYLLRIGATDMGTGCDTILAQMASEVLLCSTDNIRTAGVDTDHSPYDTGSYASSTTYVTGGAVVKAAEKLKSLCISVAAGLLSQPEEALTFSGDRITSPAGEVSLREICAASLSGSAREPETSASNGMPVSPPPFIVGMAEVEFDLETGEVKVLNLTNVIDCGTVVNPALARVQAEGAAVQALGMALSENVRLRPDGSIAADSFMTCGIPTRMDVPDIQIAFCPHPEPTGPFGVKSIGEVVINVTAPAIADAVYRASGVRVRELPITPEKLMG